MEQLIFSQAVFSPSVLVFINDTWEGKIYWNIKKWREIKTTGSLLGSVGIRSSEPVAGYLHNESVGDCTFHCILHKKDQCSGVKATNELEKVI